ncbi:hypothetical protein NC653_014176 [Populus alba x Populus x berolinensis]|uniref:C3H1-type domain-containing protein n=1 Tax=Populus alba x Populus x berolinensis TaxID=444605 RepID=A0AAD6W3J2_9ROSI|nr:hypothetical protein NC653_014176 [Populus alba x Populus x berolinensis]
MMAEDEVLVMDGVLVSSVVGSGSSSNSSGKSVHKKELCRVWEDLGHCRYAANCQFAHGKEELHPTHFPIKNKAVVHNCNSYVTSPRSSPYVPKCRILHPAMTKAAVAANQTAFSKIPGYTSISPVTISSEKFSKNSTPHSPHLITFSEPTSLPCQNIAIKAQLPTLNLKTLEWFSLLPSARTTGHHRMMALRLPCLIKLINAYQGQKWMPIFTVFFMVQLQRRGCLSSVSFALDELQVQMPFSHDTYTLQRKL